MSCLSMSFYLISQSFSDDADEDQSDSIHNKTNAATPGNLKSPISAMGAKLSKKEFRDKMMGSFRSHNLVLEDDDESIIYDFTLNGESYDEDDSILKVEHNLTALYQNSNINNTNNEVRHGNDSR